MIRETRTENGLVKGIVGTNARVTVFKGIPYAAPPVGENRWRAPQPAENWEGVRECYEFGPIAMQNTPGADPEAFYSKEWHVDPDIPMSEDCLYLNIWTNAKSASERKHDESRLGVGRGGIVGRHKEGAEEQTTA